MAKQHLLIVDSDPKSLRVLEVSLKKAGFSITRASNGLDAIEKIQISIPDMIITETSMPEMGGFELIEQLKASADWAEIPVMFLTAQKSVEDKIRGLEQGVEDYLTKPIFIREILARVSLVMQRRQRERLETRGSKTEFSGNLSDMGIIDLIQTIDISQKSGVIHVERDGDRGEIFFKNGKVIDAETSSRKGEEAVYRMLVWSTGHFHIEFSNLERADKITLSTQGLLMEGMRRLDEWGRLQEQLPSLASIFDVDDELLAERLGEIPDEINALLKHFDGRRSLMEVVNLCPLGDLEALTIITKLYFEGLICDIGMAAPGEMSAGVDEMDGDLAVVPTEDSVGQPYLDSESSKTAETEVASIVATEARGKREHAQTLRLNTQHSVESEPAPPPRQSLQGNFANTISKSSSPAAPATVDLSDEPPKRPDTGEYKLSRHPLPVADSDDRNTVPKESDSANAPSAGLSSGVSEQQTMMMHVSRTPTNPPPAVAGNLSKAPPNPVPVNSAPPQALVESNDSTEEQNAVHGDEATASEDTLTTTENVVVQVADVPSGKTLSGGIATPDDFNEMVDALPAEAYAPGVGDAIEKPFDAQATAVTPTDGGETKVETAAPSAANAHKENIEAQEMKEKNEELRNSVAPVLKNEKEDLAGADEGDAAEGDSVAPPDDEVDPLDDEEENEVNEDEETEEDDEGEDEWAALDERSAAKKLKKILIGAAAILLLGGGAAVFWGTPLIRGGETKKTVNISEASVDKSGVASSQSADLKNGNDNNADAKLLVDTEILSAQKVSNESAASDSAAAAGTEAPENIDVAAEGAEENPADKSSAVNSAAPSAENLQQYQRLVDRASKMSRTKKIEALEKAIALHPNGVEALTEYAISTMEKRKFQDQSLEYAKRVTLIDPQNAKAWLAIGYIYQLKNDTEKSVDAYKRCSECDGPKEFVRNCKLLAR